jgi:hypothetical protein
MFAGTLALHVLTVCRVRNFWVARTPFFDGGAYLEIASIIRQGSLWGHARPYHFWGFPMAIAGISRVFSIPQPMALVLISVLASLTVSILVYRLYGGWVAAAFIFINYQWIELSVEGGSEPLFMCLLFASFLAARSERWNLAALLAALSTTVRPLGVFALLAFAVILVWRRKYRQTGIITLIGLAVGGLYILPIWSIMRNPFANFSGYRAEDWGTHGRPLIYPFGALVPSYIDALHRPWQWPVFLPSMAWLAILLIGTATIWLTRSPQGLSFDQPEFLFLSIYTLFLISYNYGGIETQMGRFVIPVLPILTFALSSWIPHDRRLLWLGALFSALVASAGVVGFANVFGFKLR